MYWSLGISRELVARAIEGSICFGVYHGDEQVGFARVITDRATFAYLCDVYIVEAHRGKGLGKWMIQHVVDHPSLQGLRRFMLVTRDAAGLYRKFGFQPTTTPERIMEVFRPGMYQQPESKP